MNDLHQPINSYTRWMIIHQEVIMINMVINLTTREGLVLNDFVFVLTTLQWLCTYWRKAYRMKIKIIFLRSSWLSNQFAIWMSSGSDGFFWKQMANRLAISTVSIKICKTDTYDTAEFQKGSKKRTLWLNSFCNDLFPNQIVSYPFN